jgi:glucose-1-phosphate thymidylyltransferase
MRGIVLAGGTGSRLYPLTVAFSKQLLPVFDKPLIFYPIGTLMAAGINEILIITTPQDQGLFRKLLGSGEELGINLSYAIQNDPKGIPDAFLIANNFIGNEKVALILGDNIFFGTGLGRNLKNFTKVLGARIFGYEVTDPERYGVATLDKKGSLLSLEEKPTNPKTNLAVTGLYFYDNSVVEKAKNLKPSQRGELEITDLNALYLADRQLSIEILPRGTAWLDTGTFDGLNDASNFVRVIEERQGTKIACLEEIAWRNGWITNEQLIKLSNSPYRSNIGHYLRNLLSKPEISKL